MKIEKRDVPRTFIKIQINYECGGAYLYDYSKDLSEGGIFIGTDKPLSIGEKLKVKFILPELLEEVETVGTVTWVNKKGEDDLTPGMGVRFDNLSDETKELINKVIGCIEKGKSVGSIEN